MRLFNFFNNNITRRNNKLLFLLGEREIYANAFDIIL